MPQFTTDGTQNLSDGNPSGTRLGDTTTSLVGFFGATPVVRQASTAAGTDATTTQAAVNAIRTALLNLGLIA